MACATDPYVAVEKAAVIILSWLGRLLPLTSIGEKTEAMVKLRMGCHDLTSFDYGGLDFGSSGAVGRWFGRQVNRFL
ncbi:MAG TPA: hypothetical protein GX521_07235 [Firmicutes bacterium]|nr:hypothetical protein [Bacillota bacterium]